MENEFADPITILDIPGLAAFLVFRGVTVTYHRQPNGRVVAHAPALPATYQLLAEFQGCPTVPLGEFLAVQRRERGKMLDLRENGKRERGADHGPKTAS